MRPYAPRKRMWVGWRVLLAMLLLFVAAFYGLMTAVLPVQLLVIPLVPILLVLGLCLWLLPDVGGLYDERFETYMWWFIGFNMVWPGYVALDLPGLPWIAPLRVVMALLVMTFLFNIATSSHARHEVSRSMNAVPVLNRLFWAFWLLTTVTLVVSPDLPASMNKYANNQIFWTLMFPLAALVGRREGMIKRACTILVVTSIFVACVGINEYRIQKVIWIDYLPQILRADEEIIDQLSQLNARAGTTDYRVRGPQFASLYFAECLSMVFPLVVHYTYRAKDIFNKLALLLGTAAMITTMYLTGARSGVIGILLTLMLYLLFAAVRRRAENPVSLGATAMLMAYPATVGIVALLVVFWRRAHVMVLGGGQHQNSSIARDGQWDRGWSILARNPFGHGVDRSAEVLGFRSPNGKITIDSYYLSVMLDYGIIALPIFLMMFSLPLWYGFISLKRVRTPEMELIAPLSIGLFNFLIIKSVLSSTSNFPLAFIMLGFMVALIARMQSDDAVLAREKTDTRTDAEADRQIAVARGRTVMG
ncbi:O-antigen ligase family protein [Polymorphobacter sp.]|uniref:O-antigen ligase family protein n=1 Tax=Polymorphobacter sp. TaxID=1909290 RepID=UPI003F72BFE1